MPYLKYRLGKLSPKVVCRHLLDMLCGVGTKFLGDHFQILWTGEVALEGMVSET